MTGPVGYWHLSDIQQTLQRLLDAVAQPQQAVRDVSGGKLIASAKDADATSSGCPVTLIEDAERGLPQPMQVPVAG